jgi:hypothetical protein
MLRAVALLRARQLNPQLARAAHQLGRPLSVWRSSIEGPRSPPRCYAPPAASDEGRGLTLVLQTWAAGGRNLRSPAFCAAHGAQRIPERFSEIEANGIVAREWAHRASCRAGGQGKHVHHHPEIPAYARVGSGSFPTGAGRLRAFVAGAAGLQGVLLARRCVRCAHQCSCVRQRG